MFKKSLLILTSIFLLTSCGSSHDDSTSTSEESLTDSTGSDTSSSASTSGDIPGEDYGIIDSIQDTSILHAWNWKMNDIRSRLQTIYDAGYRSIQISPMQPKLDKTDLTWSDTASQWWRLYQPLDFKVAEANENYLGTKEELTSLCTEAKKLGLRIVVDIVSNHLAGKNDQYNSQVYTRYPLHTYNGNTSDSSIEATVWGRVGGLPDVDTGTTQVQNAVLNMLKEYLDCGVNGFRFDTAKHIETPEDGAYASDFWPTVLEGATSYANLKNYEKPYYYGEILYQCGGGRSWDIYTKRMSIIDNTQGSHILSDVINKSTSHLLNDYYTGADADHLVLWAESHDTYANDSHETTYVSSTNIKKTYVIQASRKDAASLYFARPSSMSAPMSSIADTGWKDQEIIAINKFHNRYIDKSENLYLDKNCFINVRGEGDFAGAAIVNINCSNEVRLSLNGLVNGSYTDLASGKKYEVIDSKANISFKNDVCILVPSSSKEAKECPDPSEEVTYSSSVVIKGAPNDKTYLCYRWTNNSDGSFISFNTDNDAIGVNLNNNENYIIVEFPLGTTPGSANWGIKIRQTNDLRFDGNQIIYNFENITWKS